MMKRTCAHDDLSRLLLVLDAEHDALEQTSHFADASYLWFTNAWVVTMCMCQAHDR